MNVTVKGFDKVEKFINESINKVKNPRKILKQSSLVMWRDVLDHFRDEQGESGKWKKSMRAIRQDGQTLQDKGDLRGSIVNQVQSISLTNTSVSVGTNIPYADKHNEGLDGMPKREFMWLSATSMKRIGNLFITALEKG